LIEAKCGEYGWLIRKLAILLGYIHLYGVLDMAFWFDVTYLDAVWHRRQLPHPGRLEGIITFMKAKDSAGPDKHLKIAGK
jgi:hypothetical protein